MTTDGNNPWLCLERGEYFNNTQELHNDIESFVEDLNLSPGELEEVLQRVESDTKEIEVNNNQSIGWIGNLSMTQHRMLLMQWGQLW